MRWSWFILLLLTGSDVMAREYLTGYDRTLAGGGFPYHAPQPDATTSLLIRAESDTARIAWLTEPVPEDLAGDVVRFLMLAAIDVNDEDPRRWTLRVDGREVCSLATPRGGAAGDLVWEGPQGSSLAFRGATVDKYDDLMGPLVLTVPRAWTRPGQPLTLEVTGEGALSRTWFMVYEYAARDRVAVSAQQAVRRGPTGPQQVLKVEVVRYAPPAAAEVAIGPHRATMALDFGYNVHYLAVPEITTPVTLPVTVVVDGETMYDGEVALRPVPRRTVHLLAHSHVDIGYTHVQAEVERLQWQHLEQAMALAARTTAYPVEARYRWNSEVAWAVDSYLRAATPAQREALIAAVQGGDIEIDALFANELTALCAPAELLELTAAARRVAATCGVALRAAMITDIPGFTWSLVPVLARSGVRYFSIGPNRGHRIGHVLKTWGDRPFWWQSPSGEEKVLCWVHAEGYSLFHTKMYAEQIENRLDESTLLPYLGRLADADYPHETVTLRYSVGSDNGPPHDAMPAVVRDWNARHVTPRLVISTVSTAFAALEQEAGDTLPVVRGDLTAFWEDGAASTARETALGRAASERLAQAEVAWTLRRPAAYPREDFQAAWREVLLWDEHTWGSWNSISEPDAALTRDQWAAKQAFAEAADASSRRLLAGALGEVPEVPPATIAVINTEAWPRTDLVRVPAAMAGERVRVVDDAGQPVVAQRLAGGELAFVARDVPPLGSRVYRLETGPGAVGDGPFVFGTDRLTSDAFAVRIDPADGSVRSLVWQGTELVDDAATPGLNGYLYVPGRDPAAVVGAGDVTVEVGERGPVVSSLRVTSAAPGCERLVREVVLVAGLDRVELVDAFDKAAVRAPEAVHLAFPFAVPDGEVRYDLAIGLCRAEHDQLASGNRNHLTAAYGADVSNGTFGVTLACPDAPLLEAGRLRADPIVTGWDTRLEPSSALFGYVMNNYWETNYRAEQPGLVTLRYRLLPHGPRDAVASRRFAVAARRPLLVTAAGDEMPSCPCPTGPGIEVVAMRPVVRGVLMTLHNAGEEPARVTWTTPPTRVRLCDLDGGHPEPLEGGFMLPAHGLRSVVVENR